MQRSRLVRRFARKSRPSIWTLIEPLEPRVYLSLGNTPINPVGSYLAPPSFVSAYQLSFYQDFAAMTSDSQLGISTNQNNQTSGSIWTSGGNWNDFIYTSGHDAPFGIDGSGAGSNYLTLAAQQQTGSATLTSFALTIGSTTYYQDGFTGNGPFMGSKPSVTNTNGNNWTMTQNGAFDSTSSLELNAYDMAPNGSGILTCPADNQVEGGVLPVNTISGINSGVTLNGTQNFTLTATFTNPTRGTLDLFLSGTPSQSYASGSYSLKLASGASAGVTCYHNASSIGTGSSVNAANSTVLTLSYNASSTTLTYQVNGVTAKSLTGVTAANIAALEYVGFDFNNNSGTTAGSTAMWNDWSGNWSSAILDSTDGSGNGFTQEYGYFVASMKTPYDPSYANGDDPNTWPAFWMTTTGGAEIDATESYGNYGTGLNQSPVGDPTETHGGWHDWSGSAGGGGAWTTGPLNTGYCTYGVDIEPSGITYYLNNQPYYWTPIYASAQSPANVMVDLALGGGSHNGQVVWENPTTGTTSTYGCYDWNLGQNPSDLQVQYIAVYASPNSPNYVGKPIAPANLAAAGDLGVATQVNLSWNAVSNAGWYDLYRGTSPGGEGSTPVATYIYGTSYSNTGLTSGSVYYYTVAAANGAGLSPQSTQVRVTTPTLSAGGLTAIGVQFVGQGTALGATTTAGYPSVAQAHWNTLTGTSFSSVALGNNAGNGTPVTLSGSASGTYTCASGFTSGSGNYNLASGEVVQVGPFPPANSLVFSNIPYGLYNVYIYAENAIAGRATTFALTAGGVTSYYSLLSENNATSWTIATSTWNGSGSVPGSVTTANCAEFTAIAATSFTLQYASPSNASLDGIQIVQSLPTIPTGLSATPASNTQINLSWNPVPGASSYNIYRSTTSNAEGTTPIATGITTTTYLNSGLTSSTAYYYTIAAVNSAGTGSQSAEAIATTAGNPPTVTGVYVGSTAWNSSFISYLSSDNLGNSAGYLVPTGGAQWIDLPWVNLNQISISFSENINLSSDALTLVGVNQATYTPSGFTYNSGTQTATWTLPSALGPDKLIVALSAALVSDGSGNQLAGAWTNGVSTYPSTGAAGTDLDFRINVVPGDINQSGATNATDIVWARIESGQSGQVFADLDGSGAVDGNDVSAVRQNIGAMLPTTDPINPAFVAALAIAPTVPAIDPAPATSGDSAVLSDSVVVAAPVAPASSDVLPQSLIVTSPVLAPLAGIDPLPGDQAQIDPAVQPQIVEVAPLSLKPLLTVAPQALAPAHWVYFDAGTGTATDPGANGDGDSLLTEQFAAGSGHHKHKPGVLAPSFLTKLAGTMAV